VNFQPCRILCATIPLTLVLALTVPASAQLYTKTNLVSDVAGIAGTTDPLLVNPWGVALSPTSPFWVANAGSKTATLYSVDPVTGAVAKVTLNVAVAIPPSGQIYNPSADFVISQGGGSGPARFIFAGLNGTVWGWNASVPPPPTSSQAVLAATSAPAPLAYTGLALGMRGSNQFLYVANNAVPGRIDVYDSTFVKVSLPGNFIDPALPAGDLPFNIANIGGSLYVTYYGPTGVINVFDTDGNFVKRFATGGTLLNPWGMVQAPSGFGQFGGALLVGNFNLGDPAVGSGSISAFDISTGNFLGLLMGTDSKPLSIDGLWALAFGNGTSGGNVNTLYFSAGIQGQTHGLFGSLAPVSACQGQGPLISQVSASPSVLWPPNHKLVSVMIGYTVADTCDAAPVCSLTVASNEGSGGGSGSASQDWQVVSAHEVDLRATREGSGSGRTYTITVTCKDSQSLSSSSAVTVSVPHDRGH
jgi:uncharacterized protein (TIGR03118 family)